MEKNTNKSDDELSINFEGVKKFFSKVKNKFEENKETSKYKKHPEHSRYNAKKADVEEESNLGNTTDETDLNISLSKQDIVNFFKKNALILLLLIPIILSTLIRIQPYWLPITDIWAQQTVDSYYRNQIASLINQQYPNLPDQNKQALIDKEFNKLLESNGEQRELAIKQSSNSFKDQLKNPNGIPYLLDLDSYYYMRYAENVLKNGHSGTYMLQPEDSKDQKLMYSWFDFSKPASWDGERMAPIGSQAPAELHQYLIVFIHKITSIFGNN